MKGQFYLSNFIDLFEVLMIYIVNKSTFLDEAIFFIDLSCF